MVFQTKKSVFMKTYQRPNDLLVKNDESIIGWVIPQCPNHMCATKTADLKKMETARGQYHKTVRHSTKKLGGL